MPFSSSIEAYPTYVERKDIIELTWDDVKENGKNTDAKFASVFKSMNYNPIMLINATAQIALTHHLDDELSKEVSTIFPTSGI